MLKAVGRNRYSGYSPESPTASLHDVPKSEPARPIALDASEPEKGVIKLQEFKGPRAGVLQLNP